MCGESKLEAAAESNGGDGGNGRDREGGDIGEGRAEESEESVCSAETEMLTSLERGASGQRKQARTGETTYSSWENPLLSFRSAPAQNELSTALATIKALVGPFSSAPAMPPNRLFQLLGGSSSPVDASYCEWTLSTSLRSV